MRLIDPARSSQFVEWHNSGTTTLTHAICTPNLFFEFPEDQVTTNFIYPISSNFVAISHKLLRPTQFLEKFLELLECSTLQK